MTHSAARIRLCRAGASADDGRVTYDVSLLAARESLAHGRWEQARQQLAALLADRESPEALDGMGTALWWLGQIRESLDHRERAYAGYRAGHREFEAALVALDVSVCYLSNLDNPVAARGWIARARRAADISGDERLSGWLWLMEGYTSDDPQVQRDLLTRALALARERNDLDLELAALADLGLALVANGEVPDGLRLLDEAMAGTLGGECQRLDTVVWTSCSMLAACSLIGDQKRAAQWCAAAERFAETYGCPFLQARCRSHYGRVLVAAGQWHIAETQLNQALSMSADLGREPRVEALTGLAELRLRQGAVEEAERLLADVGDGPDAVLVTAEVMTAQGHPDRSVAVLQAQLASMPGTEARYPMLVAGLVDAYLACGDIGSAVRSAGALQETSAQQHPQTTAATERAGGLVAAATGRPDLAAQRLRHAVAEFDQLGLPFHAARTRFELARVVADTEPSFAVVVAGRALDRLERLGAVRDAAEVAAFLRSLGVATKPGPRQIGVLSRRELDVLAGVQRGLTNPEIAAELFISPKTVAHHVSRILAKLGLRTRAEAAAFAATYRGKAPNPRRQ
jgi:ATP/maltotriose-dependent transcriptional regulator MalT